MCGNSCLVTTAYVFLLLAVLACSLSYVAPFWILFPTDLFDSLASGLSGVSFVGELGRLYMPSGLLGIGELRSWWVAGLWSACELNDDQLKCDWFWEDDFYVEKKQHDWHKATQGLFGAGVILLIIGFCLATFHVCCRCCKESFSIGSAIGSFIITGTICIGVGLGLYCGFMVKEYGVSFQEDGVMFYWGFFVGVAGALLALLSGVLFFCQGCCGRSHTGYQMTRVV